MDKALIAALFLAATLHAQVGMQGPLKTGGGSSAPYGVCSTTYYLDANNITGVASDSNAGTYSLPFLTHTHLDTVATSDPQSACIMYPDAKYRTSAPIAKGFLAYWPMVECNFSGCTDSVLYDIYNAHNGQLDGTDANGYVPLWKNSGILVGGANNDTSYASVTNFSNIGPTSTGAFIVAATNYWENGDSYWQGEPMNIDTSSNPVLETPYGSTAYWGFGGAVVSFSLSGGSIQGQQHIWGGLIGGGNQYFYEDTTQQATAANTGSFSASNIPLRFGAWTYNSFNMAGIIAGAMVTNNTLSTSNYTTLASWLSGTESPRITHALTPSSDGYLAGPSMEINTGDYYSFAQTEADFKADCLALTTSSPNLQAAGYKYCTIDAGWANTTRSGGNPVPNSTNWPDGIGTGGCAYAHSIGQLCEIYLSPDGCTGEFLSSAGHETADANYVATAGADFIFYDDCSDSGSTLRTRMQTMQTAMLASGRSMAFRVSLQQANDFAGAWCPAVGGNEVSTAEDAGITWADKLVELDEQTSGNYAPGGNPSSQNGFPYYGQDKPACWRWWNNLAVGTGSITDTQGRSDMATTSLYGGGLSIGTAPSTLTSTSLTTLSNANLIGIDQDTYTGSAGPRQNSNATCGSATCQTYIRPLSNGGYAVGMLNRDTASHSITFNFSDAGLTGTYNVTHVMNDTFCASSCTTTASTSITATVPAYGTYLDILCPGSTNWNTGTGKCQ